MSEQELSLGYPGGEKTVKADVPDAAPRPWDLSSDLKQVGRDHPRKEALEKVTGGAKYSYDIRLPGMIYAKALRSPHAHAVVKKVDVSKAEALAGVLHTETREGKVLYAGQQVAGVAAESEELLGDALALVEVEYEVLPHAVTVEDARKEDAPRVKKGPNLQGGVPRGDAEKVEAAHAEADVVVESEYRTQVQAHSCLETHGCVCRWEGDALTVWASTQSTFGVKNQIARALEIPPAKVTVITEHMGGGFGSKLGLGSWEVLCAKAARQTGRPCRYMLDRGEDQLIAGNRPDSIQKCRFSVKKDGTLMGAEVTSWGTGGIAGGAGVLNPAIYDFKATWSAQYDVYTHAASQRPFRAPRHPQGLFALEGMIDELADAIGMDPLELRRKNDPHPVRRGQYETGAEAFGWHRRGKPGTGPVRRGLGMACGRWGHNARPGCAVNVRIDREGSVLVASGGQDLGTGTRTVLAIVVAEELGLRPSDIEVRIGNTNDPYCHASGGSVTTPSITVPARQAAFEAKKEIREAAVARVGTDAAEKLGFKQACALLPTATIEVTGRGQPQYFGLPRYSADVAGVQFAEVEVDVRTGAVSVIKVVAVQDCGQVVNTLTARNQIHGGVIQGISYALFEERLLDGPTGNMVNTNLLDYKIVGALDVPEIVSIPFSVAHGQTPTGASSLGEPPTTPTAGAIGNAVANALGVRVRSIPITPAKVLAALGGAR